MAGTKSEPPAPARLAGGDQAMMRIRVQFFSYCKDLTGCTEVTECLADGSTVGDLLPRLHARFPQLAAMARSTLLAVGVEYQRPDYVLHDGDEVSLFPPVQGG